MGQQNAVCLQLAPSRRAFTFTLTLNTIRPVSPVRVKLRNTLTEYSHSEFPPTTDIHPIPGIVRRPPTQGARDIGTLPPVGAALTRRSFQDVRRPRDFRADNEIRRARSYLVGLQGPRRQPDRSRLLSYVVGFASAPADQFPSSSTAYRYLRQPTFHNIRTANFFSFYNPAWLFCECAGFHNLFANLSSLFLCDLHRGEHYIELIPVFLPSLLRHQLLK